MAIYTCDKILATALGTKGVGGTMGGGLNGPPSPCRGIKRSPIHWLVDNLRGPYRGEEVGPLHQPGGLCRVSFNVIVNRLTTERGGEGAGGTMAGGLNWPPGPGEGAPE